MTMNVPPPKTAIRHAVGLLKRGTIKGYDLKKGIMLVQLTTHSVVKGPTPKPISIPLPHGLFYNNGLFIGSLPHIDSTVIVAQGDGGHYYFVTFYTEDPTLIPNLNLNEIKIAAGENAKITLSKTNDILIGDDDSSIHINTASSLMTSNFESHNSFTQASRSVIGEIKRDLKAKTSYSDSVKLTSDIYDSKFDIIGLDPTVKVNTTISGPNKNPSLVESRELIYEFRNDAFIEDEYSESLLYDNDFSALTVYGMPDRRKNRSDTLSLTLLAPNHLMEIVKGTVVDIFGNILDINRMPIPIGIGVASLKNENNNKKQSYLAIRELDRKSIAFHFELNARKDLLNSTTKNIVLPDINSNADYARNRSRFFFDIDKEGQFKLNVPASSERGNIPLLTRYENYSSIGTEDSNNPNKLIVRTDNLDILHDSFAALPKTITSDGFITENSSRGSIRLDDNGAQATPIDRITNYHIHHGTAHHDILNTCYVHTSLNYLKYPNSWETDLKYETGLADAIPLANVVSNIIPVSGDNAKAGGRSGSINFDGSIELNIGANTIDRQSMWLDTAGGIVANIGRDKQNNSAVIGMDGNLILQLGGVGISTDSRFTDNNGSFGATMDIRVLNKGGRATIIRIDDTGSVTLIAPGNIIMHAGQDFKISADSEITMYAPVITIQERHFKKGMGDSA